MKKILPLIFVLRSLLIFQQASAQTALPLQFITDSLLRHHVQMLAHDSMMGRYTGTPYALKAAEYIAKEMEQIGLLPLAGEAFLQPFPIKGQHSVYICNVLGEIPGKTDSVLFITAHYDHVGGHTDNPEEDNIYNGANDNASGIAAVLALAKYFKVIEPPYYTIVFIAFSGEEMGLYGSSWLANNVEDKGKIRQVVNLEMLGRPDKKKRPFITEEGKKRSVFRDLLNLQLRRYGNLYPKDYFRKDPYKGQRLFYRSDNYPFAEKGIPANTIMATSPTDKHYHKPSDEWNTLDYTAMEKIVKAVAIALTPLVLNK